MQPPLSVIQHTQTPRKFVLISSHGTQIVSKLRPVDHLRQLLIDNGGPDNDIIKAFFGLHNETQAAATCLVLATSQAIKDAQVEHTHIGDSCFVGVGEGYDLTLFFFSSSSP